MIQEGKFGTSEATWVLIFAITAKAFYTSPTIVTKLVGPAGWYMTLISAAAAALGFTFVYILLKRYPDKNIMEIYDTVTGKFIGSVLSLILLSILLSTASINMAEFTQIIKIYVYSNTPSAFIISFFVATIVILSFLGLEGIARYSRLISYILVIGFILVIILSSQHYETRRLFPILGNGLGTTIKTGLIRSSAYGEVIIIAIFAKSMHNMKEIKKAGYTSLLISTIIVSIMLLAINLTFAYYMAEEITAAMYEMSILINYGVFFQRIEPVFLFIWSLSSLISITILFYMVLMIYCHIFNIQDKRPVIFPLAIIVFTISLLPQGVIQIITGFVQGLRQYGWIMFFIPSLLVLIISTIRKEDLKNE